jgi:Phage integrase, N-terminal SAM-like domain
LSADSAGMGRGLIVAGAVNRLRIVAVVGLRQASYVAVIIHRRDLRLAGPGCPRRRPDDRHDPVHRPRPCPASLHRCRAACPRRVPGRIRGLTREAYTLDLRQFSGRCRSRSLPLFSVRRADIETYAREVEANGRARATVTRRLCTIGGFYKYAVEEELLDHSPAAHVRRPRLDYESHATALDRNELGALLVAAGLGPPAEHALISLLVLNGLRGSGPAATDPLDQGRCWPFRGRPLRQAAGVPWTVVGAPSAGADIHGQITC